MSEPISAREPDTLATALTKLVTSYPPGSRLHELGADLLKSHRVNRDRRAAVLKHPDLAKRLADELGYTHPAQWNGYVPPPNISPGDPGGMCSTAVSDRFNSVRFVFNQVGRYAIGEQPNDSPRREVLLEISREAWERQRWESEEGT